MINLNPTWTVPVSIIKKEIIPKMQKDPGYLDRAKIRILDGAGQGDRPTLDRLDHRAGRQLYSAPGFRRRQFARVDPHRHAQQARGLYARHPLEGLFGADYRFLSHGCVRVQGVFDYAEWLLQGTPDETGAPWNKASLLAKVKLGERDDIKLVHPVPVIWVYLTGWSNGDGPANFRNDVYGVDTAAVASVDTGTPPGPVGITPSQ